MAFFFSLRHNRAQNYAVYTLVAGPRLATGRDAAFWLASTALDSIYPSAMLLLLLLFPDGRPRTSRCSSGRCWSQ